MYLINFNIQGLAGLHHIIYNSCSLFHLHSFLLIPSLSVFLPSVTKGLSNFKPRRNVNKENLQAVSKTLQSGKIKISCRDFSSIIKDAKKGDFVYFDPPYQPVSDTANFTSYTHRDFTEDDLERLADLANQLNSKGCNVMLSNSNSKTVKKLFSSGWKIKEIKANRAINSNSQKRTGHKEIIIKNY